ncbi:MAG TPA: UDP-3-O-(3-hydroxymyristoyl)glucosamine N-acyltransferase [Candidatus Methylacidiphilales bacterium]|nr:UDP-3-O-(3-hydroxymyristoyl)glucosamine N-acyltransferase [Candidatus Methylacidiphilales bacterium]
MHTVRSLADQVGGTIVGDGAERAVTGINDLRSAEPDHVSFWANAKYEADARASRAAAILVSPKDASKLTCTRIVVESPSLAFGKISALFAPPPVRDEPGIHPTAVVAPDAVIGEGAGIQAHAVIAAGVRIGARSMVGANSFIGERTTIGNDTRLYPLVTIRERSVIGARVIIHSGTVIGSDGFGYDFDSKTGRHVKVSHTGYVQIDDDVEIGANTTVDRGRFGRTHIGEGVKIDNLVQIAHNVTIGAHSIIVSQTGISGSTSLGRYVTLAGQVGLAGHLTVGDRATITAQAGLNKDVPAGAVLAGHHAMPIRESLKVEALTRRLPELVERLKALEEKARS